MNKYILDAAVMKLLTPEKMKLIHNASLTLLEEVGVKVHNDEALDLLHGAGAYVEKDNLVKIPSYIVERALRTAPKKITLYDRAGNVSMVLEDRNIYFGSNLDCYKYLDPYTGKTIDFTREHMVGMTKIGDSLPNFDYVYCIGMLSDYDPRLGSRIAFSTALQNTSKTINFATNDTESLKDILELASMISGGKEELRRKPFIFHYAEPIPPLTHNEESIEKLLICADAGIPIVYMPYCMMGGTSPISFAATLAQTNAEILSGLVIHQSRKEGAPYIVGNMPATFDMKTTIGTYGAPEFHMMVAAASELSHYYGLPFYGTCGCTDAKTLDYQAIMETMMNTLTSLLSRSNVVHDPGFMDHGNLVSPELVLVINEALDMLKVFRKGIRVDEETLALDVIKEVGPSGHYLNHKHTLDHFKEIWYSEYMDRSIAGNVVTVNEKINTRTREIIENYAPKPLADDELKLVQETEKKWVRIIG